MTQSTIGISELIGDVLADMESEHDSSGLQVNFKQQDLKSGMLLDGKYEIKRMIGKGGMGAVYKAFDITMQRDVAIKVILSAYSSVASFRKRFQKEAISMAKVNCDHVVRIYSCEVRENDLCYIVMEYIEGETLSSHLEREGKFSSEKAIYICRQILLALLAIHSKSMIHRDLKPANIMLTPTAHGLHVHICDFGLGKEFEDTSDVSTPLTEVGLILGTPKYMSPEQCAGDKLERASDIYSLGIIFFEMLAGHAPFRGETKVSVMGQHLQKAVPFEKLGNDVQKPVREILAKALKKNHQERYVDSVAMMRAFNIVRRCEGIKKSVFPKIALFVTMLLVVVGMGSYMLLNIRTVNQEVIPISHHESNQHIVVSKVATEVESHPEFVRTSSVEKVIVEPVIVKWSNDAKILFAQAQAYGDSGKTELHAESLRRFLTSCRRVESRVCSSANRSFARVRLSLKISDSSRKL